MNKDFKLNDIVRKNILTLESYLSAKDEFSGNANIFLDANENPYFPYSLSKKENLNRYPDSYQHDLKKEISKLKNIDMENIFVGNGSDEIIDLLLRLFCEPKYESIIIMPPTYGMYKFYADINAINILEIPLDEEFKINTDKILFEIRNKKVKMIFICYPNNPTGNCFDDVAIEKIVENFNGIVVIDEAYIDFSSKNSWSEKLLFYPNLIILQTFSKAWGLAGIRLGIGLAGSQIINLLNKIKSPYNVSSIAQEIGVKALNEYSEKNRITQNLIIQRGYLEMELVRLNSVIKIYKSEGNFILIKVIDAKRIYNFLKDNGIVVRDRSNLIFCENCLRISVGTKKENKRLISTLYEFEKED